MLAAATTFLSGPRPRTGTASSSEARGGGVSAPLEVLLIVLLPCTSVWQVGGCRFWGYRGVLKQAEGTQRRGPGCLRR